MDPQLTRILLIKKLFWKPPKDRQDPNHCARPLAIKTIRAESSKNTRDAPHGPTNITSYHQHHPRNRHLGAQCSKQKTKQKKDLFLYSACITFVGPCKALYNPPPGRPFILPPTRLLWESFQPRSNYVRRLFTHISTAIYSQVLVYTAE